MGWRNVRRNAYSFDERQRPTLSTEHGTHAALGTLHVRLLRRSFDSKRRDSADLLEVTIKGQYAARRTDRDRGDHAADYSPRRYRFITRQRSSSSRSIFVLGIHQSCTLCLSSRDSASRHHPTRRLPGDRRHPVVVSVVMHDCHAMLLSHGSDQQLPATGLQAILVAPPSEQRPIRALDSRRFDGPIPRIIADATKWVARSSATAVVGNHETGRVADQPNWPADAVRELVGNAIIHRDLAPSRTCPSRPCPLGTWRDGTSACRLR